jgi:hypothetical protein
MLDLIFLVAFGVVAWGSFKLGAKYRTGKDLLKAGHQKLAEWLQ